MEHSGGESPVKIFKWCPREGARFCTVFFEGEEHAHICIRSVGVEIGKWKPSCNGPALFLAFDDSDPQTITRSETWENPEDVDKFINNCFREEQAVEILEFVKSVPQSLIIVNCEAGISRSAGVVLAFRRHFGGDTEEVYRKAIPNIYVASVMGKVLRERW